MSTFNNIDKINALLDVADVFYENLQLQSKNKESETVFEIFAMLQNIHMFINIYAINLDDELTADFCAEKIRVYDYLNMSLELTNDQNRRDDEAIYSNLAKTIYYLEYMFKHTTFKLSDTFLVQVDKFINTNTYLYNTENEDGNKVEYEDLSAVEKKYTDEIMNNIKELYSFKSSLFDLAKTDGFKGESDIKNYNMADILNYCEDSIYTLANCFPKLEKIGPDSLVEDMKISVEVYLSYAFLNDQRCNEAEYKNNTMQFLTEDVITEFYNGLK